jgi:putative transposase
MHIEFRGREYVIEDRLPNGDLRIKDVAFNESDSVPENTLLDALFASELEFLGDSRTTQVQRKLFKSFVDDLNMLDDDDLRKIETKRRYSYVMAIDDLGAHNFTKANVKPLIEQVHAEIRDRKRMPHWKTVCYRWYAPWVVSGRDLRALTPHYDRQGNTAPKFSNGRKRKGETFSEDEKLRAKEVKEIVRTVIDEVYMNEQRLSVADVHEALDIRIADENRFRDADDQLPIPHESSVYDIVSGMPEYEKDAARYGKKYADKKHKSNKQGPVYTRPLQRVEFDDTTLDLFVVDEETRMPLGRPTLTFGIDCYSRMPTGFNFGFDGPGYLAVMQCLIHSVTRKTYLKTEFPMVENDWPVYGIAEEAGVDNGPPYVSKDLVDAGAQLGTVIDYCRVENPDDKPFIERYFGRKNRQLLHRQPGTSFSNIFEKGDYDPEKNAVISFDALMRMVHVWLVDVYARSPHRGLKGIPIKVWEESVKCYPPNLPRRVGDLRILLGHVEERTIGPSGVELFTLHYNCVELASLRGKRVKVKYNPTDISVVYVHDPRRDRFIHAPALNQSYTKGLSLWQHDVIKAYVRKKMKEAVDADALRRAKKRIQQIVDEEWVKSGKGSTKAKMSRWKGIRQPNYGANSGMRNVSGEMLLEETPAEKTPLMLSPQATSSQGISDLGEDFGPYESEDLQADGDSETDSESGNGDTAANKPGSVNGHGKEPEKSMGAGKSSASQERDTDHTNDADTTEADDDDLDMTGFSGGLDLPMGRIGK